jgi:hypothetical protein
MWRVMVPPPAPRSLAFDAVWGMGSCHNRTSHAAGRVRCGVRWTGGVCFGSRVVPWGVCAGHGGGGGRRFSPLHPSCCRLGSQQAGFVGVGALLGELCDQSGQLGVCADALRWCGECTPFQKLVKGGGGGRAVQKSYGIDTESRYRQSDTRALASYCSILGFMIPVVRAGSLRSLLLASIKLWPPPTLYTQSYLPLACLWDYPRWQLAARGVAGLQKPVSPTVPTTRRATLCRVCGP